MLNLQPRGASHVTCACNTTP
ncbi:hypothetical protein EQV96_09615 [Pseudomonas sp. TMW22080]|nr:hypothetical protein [Pseudomonas sp. TMW22080]